MPDKASKCPICGRDAELRAFAHRDATEVRCTHCGHFGISRTFEVNLGSVRSESAENRLLPYLSAYIRQANERGDEVMLGTHNWKGFATAHQGTPISRKVIKLLELLASRSSPGDPVRLDPKNDPPLIDAAAPGELSLLLDHLNEIGYVRFHNESWLYSLKAKGWERLQSAALRGGLPGKCFVAMSFDASLKEAYESGIYLAVKEDCKMDPVRIDLVHHNEKICDKITVEIRSSQFMVADVTLQRPGVYFEAGLAMGLDRPVIWMCRGDDFKNVHFDTRQYNHIVWDTPQDLREKLADRIRATIRVEKE